MKLSVVLCTYNRAESLGATLESLAGLRVPEGLEWELLVVDNNSTDHTRQVVEDAATRLPCRYLFEPRQGKSFALNAGVANARGDVIAFTDDDVTVDPEWAAALWRAFVAYRCLGVGGRVVPVWDRPQPRWYSEAGPFRLMAGVIVRYEHGDAVRDVEVPPLGANLAFRKEAFSRYGRFRTDLGPTGSQLRRGEDTEFCQRVRAGGESILYVPDAVVYHPVEPARMRKQYFQSWYYQYGRLEVRRDRPPAGAVRWWGVPRYLFRDLAVAALRWIPALDPRERFYHKLECCRRLGQIAESRRPAGPAQSS